jgi:cytochrome c oxidase subunit 4
MSHAVAHHDYAQTKKTYFKVFKWLCILTVIEVAVVFLKKLHVPELLVDLLVVAFSSSKAVLVGYYYMHLKSETKWLKMIACLPVIAFAYAFVLGLDLKVYERPLTDYLNAPERTHTTEHAVSDLPTGAALEKLVEKMPEEANEPHSALKMQDANPASVSPTVSEGATPSAPETAAPQEAPTPESKTEEQH